MGLFRRTEIKLPEVTAYKVFAVEGDGKLKSPFFKFNSCDVDKQEPRELSYDPNIRISVIPKTAAFFAFANLNHAIKLAMEASLNTTRWRVIGFNLIVLRVTMYTVVASGDFIFPSGDHQILDGHYPVFESKEIKVHDSPAERMEFYREVVRKRVESLNLSHMEKNAFEALLPL
jgi:hypothetical protein